MEEEEPRRLLHITSNNSSSAAIAVVSPSFNAYSSSDSLAQIAARVVREFHGDDDDDQLWMREINDEYEYDNNIRKQQEPPQNDDVKEEEEEEEEEEFEFAFVCSKEAPTSPISAEEVFYNGQIRPSYPVFDQSLLKDEFADVDKSTTTSEEEETKPRRRPLRMLMIEEERDQAATCSSSEADDLENLPPGTYCVWAPPSKDSGGKGDRSSSAGSSSKRWKFRDLLSRSSSDGATKDTFVFFAPATMTKDGDKEQKKTKVVVGGGKGAEDRDKRRSFLPYKKQDLVGFFSNVNGLSRSLHPF